MTALSIPDPDRVADQPVVAASSRAAVPRSWLLACLVLMTAAFWLAGWRASILVDGARYHYLDDDQMISMRYARNLAEGHGPVWNPGERVEGYTNFGWMLVMAAVHAAGAPDRTASLWVRATNWLLACTLLLLTARLLQTLGAGNRVAAGGALMTLALSKDMLLWAVSGFETTLLTTLFLWTVVRLLDEVEAGTLRAGTFLMAGLLPVVRTDAMDLLLCIALAGLALGPRRRWWVIALAVVPVLAHESFRVWYYGDWLPNTYYLKVSGRGGLLMEGIRSAKGFATTYGALLAAVTAAMCVVRDRRILVLGAFVAVGMARLLFVGSDIFVGFRFLAPYLPPLLAVAAAGIAAMTAPRSAAAIALTAVVAAGTVGAAGITGPGSLTGLFSPNAQPDVDTVTGLLIERHSRRDARVAVLAAGALPYFSRRYAIDMLGKSDRHVARLPSHSAEGAGHSRYDFDWSLRTRPDFVITGYSDHELAETYMREQIHPGGHLMRYDGALAGNRIFLEEYRQHPVPLDFLLRRNGVYACGCSPEIEGFSRWREPDLR